MTIKDALQHYLQQSRDAVLASLDGLSDHDVRRPMTPTGTNLLGLVKHLAGIELGYLGDCVGRAAPVILPWYADGSVWDGADMWATAQESRDDLVDLYLTAIAHSDQSIAMLELDAPAYVEWWPEERRRTTFGHLLTRSVAETAQHAGHCDIVRESLDPSSGRDPSYGDDAYWDAWVATIQEAADAVRDR